MPELPEVEESRRYIEEFCVGRKILKADVADDDKVLVDMTADKLKAALENRFLIASRRKGKNLWLELDQRPWPAFHFGMAGGMKIRGEGGVHYRRASSEEEEWPPRFHKVLLEFEGGVELAFVDGRRFARIRLHQNPIEEPPISLLGPDALNDLPPPIDFIQSLMRQKRVVKAVLLDQSFLSGIGNWVADEVLYQAHIHPEHPCGSLTEEEALRICASIEGVIKLAVGVGADSVSFPPTWLFHSRWDKKPGKMSGHPISFLTVGGRTSAVVAAVQKLPLGLIKAQKKKVKKGEKGEEGGEGGDGEEKIGKAKGAAKRKTKVEIESQTVVAKSGTTRRGRGKNGESVKVEVAQMVEMAQMTEVIEGGGIKRTRVARSTRAVKEEVKVLEGPKRGGRGMKKTEAFVEISKISVAKPIGAKGQKRAKAKGVLGVAKKVSKIVAKKVAKIGASRGKTVVEKVKVVKKVEEEIIDVYAPERRRSKRLKALL